MKKSDFAAAVAEKTGLTKKESAAAIDAVFATITESLAAGEKFAVSDFGTFSVKDRPERMRRNPRDGSSILVPASKAPAFKASRALVEVTNK